MHLLSCCFARSRSASAARSASFTAAASPAGRRLSTEPWTWPSSWLCGGPCLPSSSACTQIYRVYVLGFSPARSAQGVHGTASFDQHNGCMARPQSQAVSRRSKIPGKHGDMPWSDTAALLVCTSYLHLKCEAQQVAVIHLAWQHQFVNRTLWGILRMPIAWSCYPPAI